MDALDQSSMRGTVWAQLDPREENRDKRRDKAAYKRKYGMRVVGQSVKKLAEVVKRKLESPPESPYGKGFRG